MREVLAVTGALDDGARGVVDVAPRGTSPAAMRRRSKAMAASRAPHTARQIDCARSVGAPITAIHVWSA